MIISMCGVGVDRDSCGTYQAWFVFNLLIDMWFILDVFVNARTGYTEEGILVDDDFKVLKHYLTGWFAADFLGSFPINLLLDSGSDNTIHAVNATQLSIGGDLSRTNRLLRLLRLFKLAKLTRMLKLGKYMDRAGSMFKANPGMLRVIQLAMMSVLITHWTGCIWWLISDLEITIEGLAAPMSAGENT